MTLNNYTKYMNRTAFGFNYSRGVDFNLEGNFLIKDRVTRFYYPINYIDNDAMRRCFNEEINIGSDKPYNKCLRKFNITQIITYPEDPIDISIFDCNVLNSSKASRNIFNRTKYKLKYCKKK